MRFGIKRKLIELVELGFVPEAILINQLSPTVVEKPLLPRKLFLSLLEAEKPVTECNQLVLMEHELRNSQIELHHVEFHLAKDQDKPADCDLKWNLRIVDFRHHQLKVQNYYGY